MSRSQKNWDKGCIFRETFQNELGVRKNGGVPASGVVINNGVRLIGKTITYKSLIKAIPYTLLLDMTYYQILGSSHYGVFYLQTLGNFQNALLVNDGNPSDRIIDYSSDFSVAGGVDTNANAPVFPNAYSFFKNKRILIGMTVNSLTSTSMFCYSNKGNFYITKSAGFTSKINRGNFILGQTSIDMFINRMELYNRALSQSDMQNLYKQSLYTDPTK